MSGARSRVAARSNVGGSSILVRDSEAYINSDKRGNGRREFQFIWRDEERLTCARSTISGPGPERQTAKAGCDLLESIERERIRSVLNQPLSPLIALSIRTDEYEVSANAPVEHRRGVQVRQGSKDRQEAPQQRLLGLAALSGHVSDGPTTSQERPHQRRVGGCELTRPSPERPTARHWIGAQRTELAPERTQWDYS